MLKEPENYEEAKQIIENSIGDALRIQYRKFNTVRSVIISSLLFGGAAWRAISLKDASLFFFMLPFACMGSLWTLVPFVLEKRTNKLIRNGTFFQDKTETEIIQIARDHVREYNQVVCKRQKDGKSGDPSDAE